MILCNVDCLIPFSLRGCVVLLGKYSNLLYIFLHSQVPYYTTQNIVFDIVPSKLSFAVNYRSVVFKVSSYEFRNRVCSKLHFNIISVGDLLGLTFNFTRETFSK